MQHTLELRHEGRRHRGLRRGKVTLGLEQIAHPMTLTYAEQLEESPGDAWCLVCGDIVELHVDGELLLDAYVEAATIHRTLKTYDFEARCKAPTIDLVQCTVVAKPRQFTNVTVDAIVRKIVEPFGFAVQVVGSVGAPIPKFTIDRNEQPFNAIARVCRMRGLFPLYHPGQSNILSLEKISPTPVRTVLSLGRNVLEMQRETDWSDRFSDYIFRGKSRRTDDTYSEASSHGGTSHDPYVGRYRPTRLQVRGGKGSDDAGTMARRERNQRAGKSESVTATVSGWRNDEGALWRPNMLVPLDAPELALADVKMLITQVDYEFDDAMQHGFVAKLELKRPETLDPDATYPAPFARGIGVPDE